MMMPRQVLAGKTTVDGKGPPVKINGNCWEGYHRDGVWMSAVAFVNITGDLTVVLRRAPANHRSGPWGSTATKAIVNIDEAGAPSPTALCQYAPQVY